MTHHPSYRPRMLALAALTTVAAACGDTPSGEPADRAPLAQARPDGSAGVALLATLGDEGTTTVTRTYDANGMLATETVDGVTTGYGYDAGGNLATITRPGNKITRMSDYKRGVAQREERPEGVVLLREVDDLGFVAAEVDGEGARTTYVRDGSGQLQQVRPPLYPSAGLTEFTHGYASGAAATQTTGRVNTVTAETFDGFGRAINGSACGATTQRTFDALGRLVFQSDAAGGGATSTLGTSYAYDYLGRVTEIRHRDNSTLAFTYRATDAGIPVIDVRDERGYTTTYAMRELSDGAQELMRIDAPVAAASVQLARNVRGQVVTATQAGLQRRWGYDAHYFLTSFTEPETGNTVVGRDDAGNMTSLTVGSNPTTYFDLDDLYRVRDIRYPDPGDNVHIVWDRNSRRREVSTPRSTRTWSYDPDGNVKEDRLVIGATTLALGYVYNSTDYARSILYPMAGTTLALRPDNCGRRTRVGDAVSDVAYLPDGQLNWITYTNKVRQTFTEDSRLRPATINVTYAHVDLGTRTYVDRALNYDLAGNLKTVTDAADASQNRSYDYDPLNRLSSYTLPGSAAAEIKYDGTGNLTQYGDLSYAYDGANRLASTAGRHALQFTYDARGNVTSDGAVTYRYNAQSRLRCARCDTDQQITYDYDGTGERISRTENGKTTYEVHDLEGNLLFEYAPATGARQEHYYVAGRRIATNGVGDPAVGKTIFYHPDIAGSPLAATDSAGALLWTETYLPYGERRTRAAASAANTAWFHAKPVDTSTGLANFGARNYDARIGRFLSVDPVPVDPTDPRYFNRYAYGFDNPLSYRDPDGKWAFLIAVPIIVEMAADVALVQAGRMAVMRVAVWVVSRPVGAAAAEAITSLASAEVNGVAVTVTVAPTVAAATAAAARATAETAEIARAAGLVRNLWEEAMVTRNTVSEVARRVGGKNPPATVVGALSEKTGKVAASTNRGGGTGCAETVCREVTNAADTTFTRATRPSTGAPVKTCQGCETTFGRDAFPDPLTEFLSDFPIMP